MAYIPNKIKGEDTIYEMVQKINGTMDNLMQLENKVTSLSEDHMKIQIGTEPPERPNNKTFWLQDLGESINLTSGGGGLIIGNASIDGSSDVWFNENI